jgi:photosystem II stability/assembly factor-like uncharacterized protein
MRRRSSPWEITSVGSGSNWAGAGLRGGVLAAAVLVFGVAAAEPEGSNASVPIEDNLYGASFVDANLGWVVGAFGVIFHTSDGGKTWRPQVSHTTHQLFDVDFPDARDGWIVGRSGLILHTGDGGETWSEQKSGVEKHLFAVDFVDPRHGCAVGDWGAIVTTNDGGESWQPRPLSRDVILNDVDMVSSTEGWIAGEMGTILHTRDGGRTWTRQDSGVQKSLFGVYFADAERGWTVGIDALILHTGDGGRTWSVLNGSTEVRGLEQVGFSQAYENPSLYAVSVVGDMGVAAGEIGAIFLSEDGGITWHRKKVNQDTSPKWYRALSIVPGTDGVIVGAGGQRAMIVGGRLEIPEVSGAAEEIY